MRWKNEIGRLGIISLIVTFTYFSGGVALIRAAAKNHQRVAVICDNADYETVINEISNSTSGDVSLETKLVIAVSNIQ